MKYSYSSPFSIQKVALGSANITRYTYLVSFISNKKQVIKLINTLTTYEYVLYIKNALFRKPKDSFTLTMIE